jgi:hypothetical protein
MSPVHDIVVLKAFIGVCCMSDMATLRTYLRIKCDHSRRQQRHGVR